MDDSQYEVVKEKPTKSEVVYANVKSSLKPLTPLPTITSNNEIRSKDVIVESTYEILEASLLDNTKKKQINHNLLYLISTLRSLVHYPFPSMIWDIM